MLLPLRLLPQRASGGLLPQGQRLQEGLCMLPLRRPVWALPVLRGQWKPR